MAKVFITSVLAEFVDLVQVYAENEGQGGGRLKSFDYDVSKQCVMIEFVNETDVDRFVEKKNLTILGHEMSIARAPGESTIYIYDVPPNFKEDLDCILESPRKGGGPIKDLMFIDEMKAAEVTFVESKVARHFVDQGTLKMGSQLLSISFLPPGIYRPQFRFHLASDIIRKEQWTDSIEDVPPFRDNPQQQKHFNVVSSSRKASSDAGSIGGKVDNDEKLILRAFQLPSYLNEEYLKMLLENERFGGGALHSYQFFDDEKVAHFSFVCDQVARTMLSAGVVKLDGINSFRVQEAKAVASQENTEISGECSGVIGKNVRSSIIGLKLETSMVKEEIILYIESKRSGGGPIRNMTEINPSVFIIQFCSAKDAESFCARDHSTYFKGRVATAMLEPWPEDVKPCAIYVEGFKKTATDVLKLYFENPRSGGKSESVQQVHLVKNGVACLVFNDPSVVSSILAKGAWKLGKDLKVVACRPARPPPLIGQDIEVDPHRLRFTEINLPSLNHKEFKDYVSTAAKSKVEQVTFEKDSGQALVKFAGKPDYRNVLETLCRYPFCGIMISVEKVPFTDSVSITSTANISPELLKLYFENPRSGGGRIKDVRPCPDNTYIVQFEDYKVVDRVVKKTQKLGEANLTVKPHRESFFPI